MQDEPRASAARWPATAPTSPGSRSPASSRVPAAVRGERAPLRSLTQLHAVPARRALRDSHRESEGPGRLHAVLAGRLQERCARAPRCGRARRDRLRFRSLQAVVRGSTALVPARDRVPRVPLARRRVSSARHLCASPPLSSTATASMPERIDDRRTFPFSTRTRRQAARASAALIGCPRAANDCFARVA